MGANPGKRRKPGHGYRLRSGGQPGLPQIHPLSRHPTSSQPELLRIPHPRTGQTLLLPGGGDQCPRHDQRGTQEVHHGGKPEPLVVGFNSPRQGLANLSLVRNFPQATGNRVDLPRPAWLGLRPTRRIGRVMALDEGSSLDLDPRGRLPLPLETPIRLLALPAWLSKRTTGLLRVEGIRPQQAPLDLTTSHEKHQFTRFYRLLQGGLCMGSAWADWNFVFAGTKHAAE